MKFFQIMEFTGTPEDAIDTPIKLIKAIRPDVLVKGGDYKLKDIVGHKEVSQSGGSVVTIPLVKGLSTSKIISKKI